MKIKIIACGTGMPHWIHEGFTEYSKRLPRPISPELIEIPLHKRLKNSDIDRFIQQESKLILTKIAPKDFVIALDVQGDMRSTENFAEDLTAWQQAGLTIVFLIGGPEGLTQECLKRANSCWSLSRFTFPHPLVRVILIEQLYRAWTLVSGHPYHRN